VVEVVEDGLLARHAQKEAGLVVGFRCAMQELYVVQMVQVGYYLIVTLNVREVAC
jgi:hypothetical protein